MLLELKNLTKSYAGRRVVDDLSLSLERGELLCILGASGCGKTTTLSMIGGFVTPDEGSVWIAGGDVTALPPEKRSVTTVFQSYGLFPHMSVLQNVTYGLRFRPISRSESRERGERYLDLVGLSGRENARIGELSGGEQQRVALARALIVEPKLCLLDEPMSNLDAALRTKMRSELKRIQRETGVAMVFVTHDQEEAIILSDRMAVMDKGRLLALGTPEEIYKETREPFVREFLGVRDMEWREDGSVMKRIKRQED